MGYNSTIVIVNDAIDMIANDKDFGKSVANAIRSMSMTQGQRVDIASGNHCNAAHLVEIHHADESVVVVVGGNLGVKRAHVYGWKHNEDEVQRQLIEEWACRLGYELVKKKA
jgi:hypothetical protein